MGNVHMEAAQINYRGGEKKMSVEEALKNTSGEAAAIAQLQQGVSVLNDVKVNKFTIAPTFSDETAYDPGDLVYYNGLTYRCVNAHEGEWDADDFSATTIDGELAELRSGLTEVNSKLNGLVKKISVVSTTDSYGDFMTISREHLLIAAIPDRTKSADGCYSSWFSVSVGIRGDNSAYSLKVLSDSNTNLSNTKVAVDLYYI